MKARLKYLQKKLDDAMLDELDTKIDEYIEYKRSREI